MTDKVFVDTNVLIYAHDADAGRKRAIAAALLKDLWREGTGLLSAQVLQEFYVNVTRKIPRPLAPTVARDIVRTYAVWEVAPVTAVEVIRASEVEERESLSFWDALIVVSASRAGATKVVTEDLNPGQRIEGVLVENPFTAARA